MIVVNDCYRLVPDADALVALDADWWNVHGDRVRQTAIRECFTVDRDVHIRYGATYLDALIRDGLSLDWDLVHYGADSGHMAVQLAVLHGAARVVLLGYDMGDGENGERHWFGDHPPSLRNSSPYYLFLEKYEATARWARENGVEIVNASRRSQLQCFPRIDLRSAL